MDVFDEFFALLADEAPEVSRGLTRPGHSAATLDRVEDQLGFAFPSGLRSLLARVDGEDWRETGVGAVLRHGYLLPLFGDQDSIMGAWAARQVHTSRPRRPYVLPIAKDFHGATLLVDCAPGSGLLLVEDEFGNTEPIAPSLSAYIETLAARLSMGAG